MTLVDPLIQLVNQVPYARVISYGALAEQLNIVTDQTTSGWLVGRLLTGLPESQWHKLPRWRVINKQGYISTLKLGRKGLEQIKLLQEEGIKVNNEGYVDMGIYEWRFPREDLFFSSP